MDIKSILSKVDHTLLARDATWEEIKGIIDDGIRFGTASVCIPPCFVKRRLNIREEGLLFAPLSAFQTDITAPQLRFLKQRKL